MPRGVYKKSAEHIEKIRLYTRGNKNGIGNKSKTGIPQTNTKALANLKNGVRFEKGKAPWNKGIKRPEMTGENHFAWKGGMYDKDRKLDMGRANYRAWRMAVLERDAYKCVWCGEINNLNVDHIKSYAKYPELRYAVDNGRVLCVECHKTTETYGNKKQV